MISAVLIQCLRDMFDPLHDCQQLHFVDILAVFLFEFVWMPPSYFLSDFSLYHCWLLDMRLQWRRHHRPTNLIDNVLQQEHDNVTAGPTLEWDVLLPDDLPPVLSKQNLHHPLVGQPLLLSYPDSFLLLGGERHQFWSLESLSMPPISIYLWTERPLSCLCWPESSLCFCWKLRRFCQSRRPPDWGPGSSSRSHLGFCHVRLEFWGGSLISHLEQMTRPRASWLEKQ